MSVLKDFLKPTAWKILIWIAILDAIFLSRVGVTIIYPIDVFSFSEGGVQFNPILFPFANGLINNTQEGSARILLGLAGFFAIFLYYYVISSFLYFAFLKVYLYIRK